MMKHVSILFLIFLTCFWAGCSDDDLNGGNGKPKEGILLTLSNGSLANQTKAPALASTANLHHVTDVYAFLYQMNADGTDGTFKLCKKLDWNPMDSFEYRIDRVQFYQFWLSEDNEAKDLPAGTYRMLCIGLDNQIPTKPEQKIEGEVWPDKDEYYHTSGATYNLPEAIKDKPLSEAVATLAKGKTKENIAHSELFAGWTDFEYFPGTLSEVSVEMKRRVAGVICYLTDIPYSLNTDGQNYRITGIRLSLSQPQNTSIPLCRKEAENGQPADDFGTKPFGGDTPESEEAKNGMILAERSFYREANNQLELLDGYSKQSDENLYKIDNTGKQLKPNSILFGAYLLPMKASDNTNNSTLTVELLGRKMDSDVDSDSKHPLPTEEEVVVRSFPALDIEQPGATGGAAYSIYPNYIYQIGRKPTPALSPDEYPESLIGNRLKLCVKPWQSEEIPVEYPEVPIYAMMSSPMENRILDCMGTPWYEEFRGQYPFGTDEIEYHKLHITPSLLGKPWKLVIANDGLYVRKPNQTNITSPFDEEFVKEYSPSDSVFTKPVDLDMLLEDYIVERDYQHGQAYKNINIADDYRTIEMRLYTYNDTAMNTPLHCDTIRIKQYNAITVNVVDKNDKKGKVDHICAFARYDLGTTLYSSGSYESTYKKEFAYYNMTTWYIYSYWKDEHEWNGTLVYKDALNKTDETGGKPDEFEKSAIRHAVRKRIAVEKIAGQEVFKLSKLESAYWYLPTYYEMQSFMNLPSKYGGMKMAQAVEQMNLRNYEDGDLYWSAKAVFGALSEKQKSAYAFSVTKTGGLVEKEWERNKPLFIRQACVMPKTNN